MFEIIHGLALSDRRVLARLSYRLRMWIIRFYDPLVRYTLNGREMVLPLSHQLPFHRRAHPTYADNLSRLCSFIRRETGGLRMIDVGANVGDSYFLADPHDGDGFLLIEGDPACFRILERNVGPGDSTRCVMALLADRPATFEGRLITVDGIVRVVDAGEGTGTISLTTLDEVVGSSPGAESSNLLKTDVDGFDGMVLRGGAGFLRSAAPVLLFEHYPRLISLAGEDDGSVFAELAEWGYGEFLFYDEWGFLLAVVPASSHSQIADLVRYARLRGRFYFDICCFPDRSRDLRERFLEEERAFYADYLASGRVAGKGNGRRP